MRTPSIAAQAAKSIRKELKLYFSDIKFSVRAENYSGGHSVDVGWENGPTTESVDKVVKKYQRGKFDGMTDCYISDNRRKDIPQVDYVFSNREVAEEVFDQYFKHFKKTHKNWNIYCDSLDDYVAAFQKEWAAVTPREYISRHLSKEDLTNFSAK